MMLGEEGSEVERAMGVSLRDLLFCWKFSGPTTGRGEPGNPVQAAPRMLSRE